MLQNLIVHLVINGLAIFAAVQLVPGIEIARAENAVVPYIVLAFIFGILNAFAKPILKLLTCPLVMLTLGLFTVVINVALFYLTGWIGGEFGFGLEIDTIWAGILGALVVSVASFFLSLILDDDDAARRRRKKNRNR